MSDKVGHQEISGPEKLSDTMLPNGRSVSLRPPAPSDSPTHCQKCGKPISGNSWFWKRDPTDGKWKAVCATCDITMEQDQ